MARSADGPTTRLPSMATVPCEGGISPLAIRNSVVLPQPLVPRKHAKVPGAMSSETSRKAHSSPPPSRRR